MIVVSDNKITKQPPTQPDTTQAHPSPFENCTSEAGRAGLASLDSVSEAGQAGLASLDSVSLAEAVRDAGSQMEENRAVWEMKMGALASQTSEWGRVLQEDIARNSLTQERVRELRKGLQHVMSGWQDVKARTEPGCAASQAIEDIERELEQAHETINAQEAEMEQMRQTHEAEMGQMGQAHHQELTDGVAKILQTIESQAWKDSLKSSSTPKKSPQQKKKERPISKPSFKYRKAAENFLKTAEAGAKKLDLAGRFNKQKPAFGAAHLNKALIATKAYVGEQATKTLDGYASRVLRLEGYRLSEGRHPSLLHPDDGNEGLLIKCWLAGSPGVIT